MRVLSIKKIGASAAALVASLAFAAPVFAATLTCTPSSGAADPTLNCSFNGDMPDDASDVVDMYATADCSGSPFTDPGGLCTTDGVGADCDNTSFEPGFTETTTYSAKTTAGTCSNSQTYTVEAGGFTLGGIFDSADMETAATTAITQVGPYVLAVFGILMIIGIAMALIKQAELKAIKAMDPNFNLAAHRKAEAAQRRKERIPRRGRDRW